MPKPRQLFVTQSRVLAGKVEEYFSKLIESLVTAAHSPQELKKLVANKTQQGEELIDEDDEADWRSDLPKKFSLLEDDHFPMFITFDRVGLFYLMHLPVKLMVCLSSVLFLKQISIFCHARLIPLVHLMMQTRYPP